MFSSAFRDDARPHAARRASDARLRDVLGGLSGLCVQLDPAGGVSYVNDAFLEATGWARAEVVGAEWCDGFVPAGCETRALFDRAPSAAVRGEGEVFTRDGDRRVVAWDVVPVRDDAGGASGMVLVGRDVTDERRGAGERARLVRALAAMTDRDELTGLLNAHGFARIAEHAARVAARVRRTDALLWVGVENLDAAYAAHGDGGGDDAVCAVAEALRGVVRDSDVIARVAPGTFVVYAVGTGAPAHGESAAGRVRAALDMQNVRARAAGRAFDLVCTVRAVERDPGDDVTTLLERAASAEVATADSPAADPSWETPDAWDTSWSPNPFAD
jgi:PAS domain S-box-containing protein/diguanylate cyclase (GGDEF)-like protein